MNNNLNVKTLSNKDLVDLYVMLDTKVEKLTEAFNALPAEERKTGKTERAKEALVTLSVHQQYLQPVQMELAERIHKNSNDFAEYMDKIASVNPFVNMN